MSPFQDDNGRPQSNIGPRTFQAASGDESKNSKKSVATAKATRQSATITRIMFDILETIDCSCFVLYKTIKTVQEIGEEENYIWSN